jgi:hypothetical protein
MEKDDVVVYDVEQAAAEVASATGRDVEMVEDILEAEFLFNAALGFYDIPDDEEGREFLEEIRHLRENNADLLPSADEEIHDYGEVEDRLVAFIQRATGFDAAIVEEVLDEHIAYLDRTGILDGADEDE